MTLNMPLFILFISSTLAFVQIIITSWPSKASIFLCGPSITLKNTKSCQIFDQFPYAIAEKAADGIVADAPCTGIIVTLVNVVTCRAKNDITFWTLAMIVAYIVHAKC